MSEPLVVLGSSVMSAVGFDADSTCAALRAGVSGFRETGFFRKPPGLEPIMGAVVPLKTRPDRSRPLLRLLAMAEHGLRAALEKLTVTLDRTALILGAREPHRLKLAGRWTDDELLAELQRRLKVTFHPASAVLPLGNTAVLYALKQAQQLMLSGTVECCLVGGVDSLLQAPDLEFLEDTYRLLGGPVGQGLIPGEAAAFLVVTLESKVRGAKGQGRILGVGTSTEEKKATLLHGGHATGRGLHHAIEAAVTDARIPESLIEFRVSDLNGESYRGVESMLALARCYRTRRPFFDIVHPADCVGETGAAAGALLVTAALTSIRKGYAPGKVAMCETSSDSGPRAACVLAG